MYNDGHCYSETKYSTVVMAAISGKRLCFKFFTEKPMRMIEPRGVKIQPDDLQMQIAEEIRMEQLGKLIKKLLNRMFFYT